MSDPARRAPLVVHVISHTHWDREWYLPAERFRQRLVELMDALIDDPPTPAASFLLDGQTVLLDDYVAVRPERRDALAALLRSGALEAGPWYVLADELIPSGEALVRNLLAGRRVLRALGAEPPPVLYSPDAFGHPAALPALAAGFDCAAIVLWRGYGGASAPPGDTVRWAAADGTAVLLHHLPPDGYEFGSSLPQAPEQAGERWARIRDVLEPRAVLGVALLTNGADHHARQPALADAVSALARAASPAIVRRSSLRAFAAELAARAAAVLLPTVQGELRDSYGYTWTLQGTFATRARQKRRNALTERLLRRDAEPWAALAALRDNVRRGHLLNAAWTSLLLCHPHDTLCGCSIDQVARAMDAHLDAADAQGLGIRDDAITDLLGHDSRRARRRRDDWRPVVIVRNRAPRQRGGVAELSVARFRARVPIGPRVGPVPDPARAPAPFALDHGRVVVQPLDEIVRHDRVESPDDYPTDDLVDEARVVAWVPAVPGYGLTALTIDEPGDATPALPPSVVRSGDAWLENDWLHVAVGAEGDVTLSGEGFAVPSLIAFEDVGDVGDLYTHSPRGPALHATFVGARVVHGGPLRGVIEAGWRLEVPIESTRSARATDTRPIVVRVGLVLDADARALRVDVSGENTCRDHRLRLVLQTGIAGAAVIADAAFGPVRRAPIAAPPREKDFLHETVPPTAPLARYVTLAAAERGATVFADGLAEYEATPAGEVAITLLRSVGELSRADLPERPGHAGWPTPTPEAQCLGAFEGRFAVLPHGPWGDETITLIERTADDVLLPLCGTTLRSALAVPAAAHGIELDGDGLAFSACKESEDGEWVILRCVNLTDRPIAGRWRCAVTLREAHLARLDETPLDALAVDGAAVAFPAAPRAIVTVLVR